jgi:DNA-binding CsgD family transcriptional regulator
MVTHTESLMIRGANRAAVRRSEDALRVCDLVGADDIALRATVDRGFALAWLGHADDIRKAADVVTERLGTVDPVLTIEIGTVLTNSIYGLNTAGWFEQALLVGERFAGLVSDLETERAWLPWIEPAESLAAFQLGRWTEADRHLKRIAGDDLVGFPELVALTDRILLDGATGRDPWITDPALLQMAGATDNGELAELSCALALAALWAGDAVSAVRRAEEALSALHGLDDASTTAWVVCAAARAWADLAERSRAARHTADLEVALLRARELSGISASLAAGTWLEGASATPWMKALCAASEAELMRAEGHSDSGAWHLVAALNDELGARPAAAYARYREAEAELASGDRDGAAEALSWAAAMAAELGADPLARMAHGLARRARMRLEATVRPTTGDNATASTPPLADAPGDPWGLSEREREVLALVADGRTNREIGDALFISDKTASVHVTHILTKLGVSSRTEAALLAARAGILAPAPTAAGD